MPGVVLDDLSGGAPNFHSTTGWAPAWGGFKHITSWSLGEHQTTESPRQCVCACVCVRVCACVSECVHAHARAHAHCA